MAHYEVRCAEASCPHSAANQGFLEDGTGSSADQMSAHSKETHHRADGLYVDGVRVSPGNKFTKIYLRNKGVLSGDWAAGGPQSGGSPPASPGTDPEDPDDEENENEDDENAGEWVTPDGQPVGGYAEPDAGVPQQRNAGGRPTAPATVMGFVAGRNIQIDDEVARLFSAHWPAYRHLYHQADPADEDFEDSPPLEWNAALSRWIIDIALHDMLTRAERYPIAETIETRVWQQMQTTQAAQDAQWKSIRAYEADLARREREVMDRQRATAGGAPNGGA